MIDIVIPVYNALADLKQCIASLKAHLDFSQARVLLVEDCSTDPAVLPYLESIADQNTFILIRAKENGGFSQSVNLGISFDAQNDVILLNSDTIVTARFAEKLRCAAYSRRDVGTVTPLSNNGSICSIPEFIKSNPLPKGFTVDRYAQLVEECSLCKYPTIPVAVGFCMYITRRAIQDTGPFDAATFGRGYGEENDYCYRMEQLGYCHLLCDNTFIWHRGEVSFQTSDFDQTRKQVNEQTLFTRYRAQVVRADEFIKADPLRWVRDNIALAAALRNGKKTVWEYLHIDFKPGEYIHAGGTQLHVRDIISATAEEFNYVVTSRDQDVMQVTVYADGQMFEYALELPPPFDYPVFRDRVFAAHCDFILRAFAVSVVHIQHLHGQAFDVFYEARRRNIPVLLTLHDYYLYCPTYQLLNAENECCRGIATPKMCQNCLTEKMNCQVNFLAKWRSEVRSALALCSRIFVPSETVREDFLREYPEIAPRLYLQEHGLTLPGRKNHSAELGSRIHLAFTGGMAFAKGSTVAAEMIEQNTEECLIWHFFGMLGDQRIWDMQRADVIKHGQYEREQILNLLTEQQIDLILILSVVPESFCYTLSEALLAGIPVIVTDMGALGPRVRAMDCGWIVPADAKGSDILDLIRHLRENPTEYAEKCANIRALSLKSAEQMAEEYAAVYRDCPQMAPESDEQLREALRQAQLRLLDVRNRRSAAREANTDRLIKEDVVRQIEEMAAQIKQLNNEVATEQASRSYQLVQKARRWLAPFQMLRQNKTKKDE